MFWMFIEVIAIHFQCLMRVLGDFAAWSQQTPKYCTFFADNGILDMFDENNYEWRLQRESARAEPGAVLFPCQKTFSAANRTFPRFACLIIH